MYQNKSRALYFKQFIRIVCLKIMSYMSMIDSGGGVASTHDCKV